MLQDIQHLYGNILAASDGEIGHVKDFYFDDKTWIVRYLGVDTGNWLSGRQVLLSPHSFGHVDRDRNILPIKLTRKQIENSPPIDSHRPVSRQYELDYYQHYGLPVYWVGDGAWGWGGLSTTDAVAQPERPHHGHNQRDDVHLRSTRGIAGYDIQATDGAIGSVKSYLVDDKNWAIHELVVETGHWYSGKEILIETNQVERVSYDDSKVFVKLARSDIALTEEHGVATVGV